MEMTYVGSELELFREAHNWKDYYRSFVDPHLGPRVLEVGAGLGGTTQHLCRRAHESWVCLEPDAHLAGEIAGLRSTGRLPAFCEVQVGTVGDLAIDRKFDSILYMDVLEHIEDDGAEMIAAADRLADGGKLIVLSPAHNWLFTPFDERIGHFRRYSKKSLAGAAPPSLRQLSLRYLDSVGMFASLANRLLLHSSMPNIGQIHFWDRRLVPCSRWTDRLLGFAVGKSVLGVWEKQAAVETGNAVRDAA